ncbi:ADP-ribosyl-[dinitrogen reductase] hydrolase [Limisalsivibrio acetivorans]|uniref:ADP-ribosyl-[dinitrogen reductase] hydrolase n=1 Tax=Limisalsivibrio acetivorans TaxID=1304888 RepID=UPI0003B7936D|nr:ADP-ribosyl-[dinitrogen reductase] hydrolase [Limisalsivibrio acetivorans]
MEADIFDRAEGAYLGFAVGDALGATVEFMTEREIKTTYGVHNRIIGGGWLKLRPGRVTDDTEMCIALGRSILSQGGFSVESAADEFVRWMRSKPVDIGSTVRRGIRDYMLKGQLISPESEFSAGNGACMRNLPMIFFCMEDWDRFSEYTLAQCHITHNNELSDLATLAFGDITRQLLLTGNKIRALDTASVFIREHPHFSFSRYKGECSGYIKDTFKTVMHHFFDGVSFEDILVRTVNQGGDADTNGALAGMLAGAMYGTSAIPRKWLRRLSSDVKTEIRMQTSALLRLGAKKGGSV